MCDFVIGANGHWIFQNGVVLECVMAEENRLGALVAWEVLVGWNGVKL
jgi:hypothetical protein